MPSFAHEGLIELFRYRPELASGASSGRASNRAAGIHRSARRVRGLDRLDCPACLLVVTPSESTPRWCREPIELGPGNVFRPLVVGPESVPRIEDASLAEHDPELAVLSVMAHGQEAHAEALGHTALLAIQGLTDDRHALYSDLVLAAVSEAVRAALEELMASGNYEFQSDFVKRFLAKGEAEGRSAALLAVLEARGLPVTQDARARILECTDAAQLDAWVRKAVSVASVDELF